MINREEVIDEIMKIPEHYLSDLLYIIKNFEEQKALSKPGSLMSKLRKIQITASKDFAQKADIYISGNQHDK